MIGTISFLVGGDRAKWTKAIVSFSVAALVAGAVFGAGLWLIGNWLKQELGVSVRPAFMIVIGPLALGYALTLTGRLNLPFRGMKRQVSKLFWDDRGPVIGGAAFGVELGAGLTTFVAQPTYWLLLIWVALVPSLAMAVVAMSVFSLTVVSTVWLGSLLAALKLDIDDVSLWAMRRSGGLARLHAVTIVATVFFALVVL